MTTSKTSFFRISEILSHLSISVHIPCFNKTEEREVWNLRTHQEKNDSVNLGKICITACFMTNWQRQCLFNNPCLLHVTRVFF